MDSKIAALSAAQNSSEIFSPSSSGQRSSEEGETCIDGVDNRHARQSGKFHPLLASYMAFVLAVLVCMAAAVTVASHDVPLMLGGY